MLHQFIYTRSFPHHDLHDKERVIPQDGFGVFALDEEWYGDTDARDTAFLEQRLPVKNASSEGTPRGVFPSFEYTRLPSGRKLLMNEVARTLCQTPRKNGLSHRSGNYVKQAVVGDLQGYPYEWLGASIWTAHKAHENDYYRDDMGGTAAPFLPMIPETEPENGNVTLDTIRGFVAGGRQEAVRCALAFVLGELARPESARRPLFIRDTPDNVALWVAAVQAALPVTLAWEVTFATNRAEPGPQPHNTLFYFTDANNNISYMMNRSMEQTRHPYCLMVGVHPKDLDQPRNVSPDYALLDGETKTPCFEAEGADRAYFRAAVRYDDDIQDFCRVVVPGLHEVPVDRLLDLYEAYQYLLDADHGGHTWQYREAVRHLKELGTPKNPVLTEYLLRQCAVAYPRLMEEDLRQELPMLEAMCRFAAELGRQEDVVAVLMDRLHALFESVSTAGEELSAVWAALRRPAFAAMADTVLNDLFNDTELEYYARQLMSATPATADTVLQMFAATLERGGVAWRELVNDEIKRAFLCVCLAVISPARALTGGWLERIRVSGELLGQTIVTVSALLGPQRAIVWWDAVLGSGSATEYLTAIKAVRAAQPEPAEEKALFEMLDGRLCAAMPESDELAAEMNAWGGLLGLLSVSAILWEFKRDLLNSRRELLATEAAKRLTGYKLPLQSAFLRDGYLDPVVRKAVELDSPFIHRCLLTPFLFETEAEREAYLERYLSRVLALDKSRHHLDSLIVLTEALTVAYPVEGRTAEQMTAVVAAAEAVLIRQIAGFYKHGMVEQVAKARLENPAVTARLTALLTEASKLAEPRKGDGFFGLFGRRK